jgi:integrase
MAKAKRTRGESKITQRKDGRWQAKVKMGRDPSTGRMKYKYIYAETWDECRREKTRIQHEADQGFVAIGPQMTTGEWLMIWFTTYKKPNLANNTVIRYEAHLRNHILPEIGKIPLQRLQPHDLQRFYAKKLQSLKGVVINGFHGQIIYPALNQAVKSRHITWNVASATEPPKPEKSTIYPLSIEQAAAFLHALEGDPWRLVFLLYLTTGLRKGELAGLRWGDLDLEKGALSITHQLLWTRRDTPNASGYRWELSLVPPKRGSTGTVPLLAEVVELLRAHKAQQAQNRLLLGKPYDDGDFVFAKPSGKPINPKVIINRFKERIKRAGLPPQTRVHDLRHTFAKAQHASGTDTKTISMLLRHKNLQTTDGYLRQTLGLSDQDLHLKQEAVNRLGKVFNL